MKKPARKIKASKKGSFRGKFPSKKNRKMIYWESLLERDYIKTLEFDKEVLMFESQPLEIEYFYCGKRRSYFPDFLVTMRTEKVYLVEVKPIDKVEEEENKIKAEVGRMYSEEKEWEYKIVTEKDIRKGYFLENFNFLKNYNKERTSVRKLACLQRLYEENIPCSISELKKKALMEMDDGEFYVHLYYMVYEQIIETNLYKEKINEETILGKLF
ncbi:TnsA endonuclease N-terminal domain-containing protein [Neobacillus sp. YIM B06451]|uniref:TnsA endonuclease N-terminal domain-containing protein n=1 Tax=Neobacillus sp. YIM B06451 TaxID=3070994 RepID=UPI00292D3CBC|nr:TnsA endonuclease N-terminal domain-containing protein [Neobacillus sp. YIM B06451]